MSQHSIVKISAFEFDAEHGIQGDALKHINTARESNFECHFILTHEHLIFSDQGSIS